MPSGSVASKVLGGWSRSMFSPLLNASSPYETGEDSVKLPGFRSFKTAASIVYPRRWHRDLLIQATLDPAVDAIEPDGTRFADPGVFGIHVRVGGRRYHLIAASDISDPALAVSSGRALVSRAYLLSEPRCSTARTIWSTRRTLIAPGDRLRILHRLGSQAGGATIASLAGCVRSTDADPFDVLLALVCEGQAELDAGVLLSPETLIRRRQPA